VFFAELNITGDSTQLRMKGCGLLVINPPWKIDGEIRGILPALVERLRAGPGAGTHDAWLVPEK
jgi:23S rRNA (adenine2030-N6)-methyltransferase